MAARMSGASRKRLYGKLASFKKRHGEIPLRFTFNFPLSRSRRMALKAVRDREYDASTAIRLLKHHDFVEKLAGLELIGRASLDGRERGEAKARIGELLKDRNTHVRLLANKAYRIIDGEAKEHPKKPVTPEKVPLGGVGLDTLKRIAGGRKYGRALTAVRALEKIAENKNSAFPKKERRAAVRILRDLSKSKKVAREEASNALMRVGGHKELLTSRRPLFATAGTGELAHRLRALDGVSKQLQKEFGERFVSINLFGSADKGYYKTYGKASDLDYRLIAEDQEVANRFRELAGGLGLCEDNEATRLVTPAKASTDLFYGISFGDRKRLKRMQRDLLARTSNKEWEDIRYKIMRLEMVNSSKGVKRVNSDIPNYDAALISAINRTPPPLDQMRKHFKIRG